MGAQARLPAAVSRGAAAFQVENGLLLLWRRFIFRKEKKITERSYFGNVVLVVYFCSRIING